MNVAEGAQSPQVSEAAFVAGRETPRWVKDLFRFLPLRSQFVMFGNIRDRFPFPSGTLNRYRAMRLTEYLAAALQLRGYRHFLGYDAVHGFYPIVSTAAAREPSQAAMAAAYKLTFDGQGRCYRSLTEALPVFEAVVHDTGNKVAVIADFASRYAVNAGSLNAEEHAFFMRVLKLSHSAEPTVGEPAFGAQFNPILWLCDGEADLPGWLALNNPRLRTIVIPRPDHVVRRALIESLVDNNFPGAKDNDDAKTLGISAYVEQTEGMQLTDVQAINILSRRENLGIAKIGEAIRRYKLGVTEDKWSLMNRQQIGDGEVKIHERVKGQGPAVMKALDIVKRAVTGLSGAQAASSAGRPRGVLFLAGPTGVGKTELAKALTELLFGDQQAYIRFDMSEFSSQHADARLLGAPPGYVGYESGGELINAVREKPVSLILFDEIEKAHPRILDKFLQILDDGMLTSGRGERVYFSDTVIVFTSNLGIYTLNADGSRERAVDPERDDYLSVEQRVRSGITRHFNEELNRPELLNRIGENIVVFDFIRQDIAAEIFDKMLNEVLNRVRETQKMDICLSPGVREELLEHCTASLDHGGRGIGNQLEARFINPLARALFNPTQPPRTTINVESISDAAGVPLVRLAQAGNN